MLPEHFEYSDSPARGSGCASECDVESGEDDESQYVAITRTGKIVSRSIAAIITNARVVTLYQWLYLATAGRVSIMLP